MNYLLNRKRELLEKNNKVRREDKYIGREGGSGDSKIKRGSYRTVWKEGETIRKVAVSDAVPVGLWL